MVTPLRALPELDMGVSAAPPAPVLDPPVMVLPFWTKLPVPPGEPVAAVRARVAPVLSRLPLRLMVPPAPSRVMPGRLSPAVVMRPLRLRVPLTSTVMSPVAVLVQVGLPAATPLAEGEMLRTVPAAPPTLRVPELVKD